MYNNHQSNRSKGINDFFYPLYLDEPSVEDQCGVGWDDLADTSLPIVKVRGDGDPTPFPQAHAHQSSVHASNDTTMAQTKQCMECRSQSCRSNITSSPTYLNCIRCF